MTEPWTLTIPKGDLPWINSNQRVHRMVTAKATAAWKHAAHREAFYYENRWDAPVDPCFKVPVRITATFHKARAGRWDACNLYPTVKAIVDGLVMAGVLVDDDNLHVIGPDMRAGEKRATACVVIQIEPVQ